MPTHDDLITRMSSLSSMSCGRIRAALDIRIVRKYGLRNGQRMVTIRGRDLGVVRKWGDGWRPLGAPGLGICSAEQAAVHFLLGRMKEIETSITSLLRRRKAIEEQQRALLALLPDDMGATDLGP